MSLSYLIWVGIYDGICVERHQGMMSFTIAQPLCSFPLCFYAHVLLWWPPRNTKRTSRTGKPPWYAKKEMCFGPFSPFHFCPLFPQQWRELVFANRMGAALSFHTTARIRIWSVICQIENVAFIKTVFLLSIVISINACVHLLFNIKKTIIWFISVVIS